MCVCVCVCDFVNFNQKFLASCLPPRPHQSRQFLWPSRKCISQALSASQIWPKESIEIKGEKSDTDWFPVLLSTLHGILLQQLLNLSTVKASISCTLFHESISFWNPGTLSPLCPFQPRGDTGCLFLWAAGFSISLVC